MNLWMVVYIAGRVVLVWHDPMPGYMTFTECQDSADQWTRAVALRPDKPVYQCEWHVERPMLGTRKSYERLE